jgi:hypothetical protein
MRELINQSRAIRDSAVRAYTRACVGIEHDVRQRVERRETDAEVREAVREWMTCGADTEGAEVRS